jgi:hypothetical protein
MERGKHRISTLLKFTFAGEGFNPLCLSAREVDQLQQYIGVARRVWRAPAGKVGAAQLGASFESEFALLGLCQPCAVLGDAGGLVAVASDREGIAPATRAGHRFGGSAISHQASSLKIESFSTRQAQADRIFHREAVVPGEIPQKSVTSDSIAAPGRPEATVPPKTSKSICA